MQWRLRVRQVKFATAVEADLISALFDSEHAAQVLVTAIAEGELKNPKHWVHKSCARCRRSATNGAQPFESGTHAGPSCARSDNFLRAPGKFHAWKKQESLILRKKCDRMLLPDAASIHAS
jgi:hypothetical protein